MAILDVTGERYGRLTALVRAGSTGGHGGQSIWKFRCDCGVEIERVLGNVRRGGIKSCGCLAKAVVGQHSVSHGATKGGKPSREWRSWKAMRDRCYRATDTSFPRYGALGITVCDEWKDDFSAFLADMGPRPDGTSIERLDSKKRYEPANCVWATKAEQNRNKSNTVWVEDGGDRLTMRAFATKHGVNQSSLGHRMRKRGETAHEALAALIKAGRAT